MRGFAGDPEHYQGGAGNGGGRPQGPGQSASPMGSPGSLPQTGRDFVRTIDHGFEDVGDKIEAMVDVIKEFKLDPQQLQQDMEQLLGIRAADEVLSCAGQRMAAAGVDAWNSVFDVTPASLVDAIVTERGVIHSPNAKKLAEHMSK